MWTSALNLEIRRLLAATLAATALLAAPAHAAGLSRADRSKVERLARSLGSRTSMIVTDKRGRTLAAVRPSTRRPLGSVTKLFTTSAALLGLTTPPRTTVELAGSVGPDGVLTGDVVLRGGGDAGLDDPGLTRLRDAVVAAGVRRISGRVIGDGSLFDAAIGGPATGFAFDPEFDGAVGALSYQHGRATPGGPYQLDPAAAAAARFDDLLEAAGVVLPNSPGSGARPVGTPLAVVDGDLPALLRAANTDSSAVTAETLGKLLAAQRTHQPGTTAAAAVAIAQVVRARLGVRPRLGDSAGFVAASQASPRDVARLLRVMNRRASFARSLAKPGAGTLRGRNLPSGCRAKTGTLRSAHATTLAGVCKGRIFAVLTIGPSPERARRVQDRIASVLGS
jgi:D-alanyl-D-alanine carboxypeptidase/D-alanyl-D-alanine-endopeptidase (penicillin-binding protein 4)